MKIVETSLFSEQRDVIVRFIAEDKRGAALGFARALKSNVNELIHFPYQYRQSDYHDSKQIRDMTFKGYTIVYRVDEDKDIIEMLEIFNRNKPI